MKIQKTMNKGKAKVKYKFTTYVQFYKIPVEPAREHKAM